MGNETLDDDDEQAKENGTETSEKEAAFNPLAESEGQSDERNPLGDDELDKPNERLNNPVNEEEALLETVSAATEQPPFINECQEEEEVEDTVMKDTSGVAESDNPLGDIDDPMSDNIDNDNTDPFSETAAPVSDSKDQPQQPLSEEDLLTGPAHNLDDSQYKADYVDPNLEDIFK